MFTIENLATAIVNDCGEGTYRCDSCTDRDVYVPSDPRELGAARDQMLSLVTHAQYDHVSPRDILKVTYTVVYTGTGI